LEKIMRILRLPEVQAKTGLKHSAIYERINDGTFPKPVPLGTKARGFIESEVDDWIRKRLAERDGAAA
jgi:prophage regulatory protein